MLIFESTLLLIDLSKWHRSTCIWRLWSSLSKISRLTHKVEGNIELVFSLRSPYKENSSLIFFIQNI
ncbi:unnamed protein product [Cuscuta campestris]|uniref:Uncharacterized protein n=1 Tax=Cuscuta campestris TaxID=132261 RepID=A0A484KF87_9ASTE|nr:unnamed protein product [Cuscuta campestris]